MSPLTLRPRSATELIDAAVQLLRAHYKELVTVTALFWIPVIIARVVFIPVQPTTPSELLAPSTLRGLGLVWLVSFTFGSVLTAATVVIVSDSYLGRAVSIGSAVNLALARFWTVIAVAILQALILGLGFTIGVILLFIPGFVFLAWFFSTTNVVMVEGKGVFEAFGRAKYLAGGSISRILGTLILTILIVGLAQGLMGALLALLISPFRSGTPSVIMQTLVGILVYPLVTVVVTLLYYDLRIRKEGFDLEIMAKELGFGSPTAAPRPSA